MTNKTIDIDLSSILGSANSMKKPMVKGALGKGISALLHDAKAEDTTNVQGERIQKIKLAFCVPSRHQARKHFNEEELNELSTSIKQKGILQPVLLRQLGQDSYEIVAGERRCRAAKMAQLDEVPAIVRNFSDKDVMEVGLIENLQRQDLNALEEAYAYKKLIEQFDYTHDEISKVVGKSRSYISNYLRILNLPHDVLEMIESGLLSAGHAKMLVNAENPLEIAQQITEGKFSVRDTEELVKRDKAKTTKIPKPDNKDSIFDTDIDLSHWQQIAFRGATDKLDIKVKTNKDNSGELKIKFGSISEIKRLLRLTRY